MQHYAFPQISALTQLQAAALAAAMDAVETTDVPKVRVAEPGSVHLNGDWQVRNFMGLHQSRKGSHVPWQFYVASFGAADEMGNGTCKLLMANGTTKEVPITSRGELVVDGVVYGRDQWDH